VRTRNEERNIERFCRAYLERGLADQVLVADGGSQDNTVKIAQVLSNVTVRKFDELVTSGKTSRNPHGKHMNFLFDWAKEEGADWIIFDDCDSVPNSRLKRVRYLLETARQPFFYAVRIYFWGDDHYFPQLSKIKNGPRKGEWTPGLWAWHRSTMLEADETDPWKHRFIKTRYFPPGPKDRFDLMPPLALLHRPWPTEEETDAKLAFYRGMENRPYMQHPTEFGGVTKRLERWMR
jgi:glycosyltransferase involved in cell wall biosynthesis